EKACHDVDDPPPALLDQAWGYRPSHHEWSIEIHIYGTAPGVRIHFEKGLAAPDQNIADMLHADAGIVDEPVHRTEVIGRLFYRVHAVLPLRDVAFDAQEPILQRFLAGDVAELAQLGSARRQIGHCHADIASNQGKRHGAPEP